MVEQKIDLKLREALHDKESGTDKITASETQSSLTIIDEDRPRSLDHSARQGETLVSSKSTSAIKIINLLSSSLSSSTSFPQATEDIDETTSSLASFDISNEEGGTTEEDEQVKQEGDSLALRLVVNSRNELVAAAIVDPIEGHDEEFDVDLSSPPLTEDELSTGSTVADNHSQLDTPIILEEQREETHTIREDRQGLDNYHHDYRGEDCEHSEHANVHLEHQHGGKAGGIYGKVVKSIQKSIRKIFQHKEHSQHHRYQQHEEKATASLYMPSSDVPSMPIDPLLPGNNNPITSVSGQMPSAMLPSMDGSLHKTLVIDVAYTRPLLDLPSPLDVGKKCLVLDLDETLVHSTFQPVPNADLIVPVHLGEGLFQPIYVCKRPGVDEFLRQVSELFEVGIFTASLSNYADPVIDFLDPIGGIKFRLYREDCLQFQGMYIKDLSRLGRSLDQVLIIDNSPASYSMQPANALGCRSWFKDPHDRELEERLLPMLRKLHASSTVTQWRVENLGNIETPY